MSRQLVPLWRVPLPHLCHLVSPLLIFVHSHDTILKINGLNFNSRNDTVPAISDQSCFSRTYGAHRYNLFTKRIILCRGVLQKLCPFLSFSEGKIAQISRGVLFHPIRLKIYLCATFNMVVVFHPRQELVWSEPKKCASYQCTANPATYWSALGSASTSCDQAGRVGLWSSCTISWTPS